MCKPRSFGLVSPTCAVILNIRTHCRPTPHSKNARSLSLENDDQQNENYDQHYYCGDLLVVVRLPCNPPYPLSCSAQATLMPVNVLIHIIKHCHVLIKLVSDLYAQVPLPADAFAQPVQLLVLVLQYLRMICMDLLVGQIRLVWRRRVGWVVAIRKECSPIGSVLFVRGRRVVAEPYRLWCRRW